MPVNEGSIKFVVCVVLVNVAYELFFGVKCIFWATRQNRRAFFALELFLSMGPVVVLELPVFFEIFSLFSTYIVQCQSAR